MVQINSTLKNKLRNYSILAGSALAVAGTANAQIIYHDINPDRVLRGSKDTMHLDLNGDGKVDYAFETLVNKSGKGAVMNFLNSSAAIAGTTAKAGLGPVLLPDAYSAGKSIGSKVNFYTVKPLEFSYNGKSGYIYYPVLASSSKKTLQGQWQGVNDKYVPVKVGNNYGWVRCSVSANGDSLTVKSYAYQSTAGAAINAGDTGGTAGVPTHQLQNVLVFSSGKKVTVKYPEARVGMTITVTDLSGREVRSVQTTTELYEMNLSDASSGIYTITVRSKDAEMTKKVSIQ